MGQRVVVVGAGMAGLVCARHLHRSGLEVLVLESSDSVGGRMRTDEVDGFLLDRGFQVYFDAYPAAKRELNYEELALRPLDSAVSVWDGDDFHEVSRDDYVQMALSTWLPLSDKLRVLSLNSFVRGKGHDEIFSQPDVTSAEFLRTRGFSDRFVERFASPFFGSVFLDTSLDVSARAFLWAWKMLNDGVAAIPARGIQEIPLQVASQIPASSIRTRTKVEDLIREGDRIAGVRTHEGEEIRAESIVIATEADEAARLTGVPVPKRFRSCTTVYFDADRPIDKQAMLYADSTGRGRVNHVCCTSNAAPSLAPAGRHLIQATCIGLPTGDVSRFAGDVRYELHSWFPDHDVASWRPLRVYAVERAQLEQKPGFFSLVPESQSDRKGLWLAGEFTSYGSIEGAVRSGRHCAEQIAVSMGIAKA